SGLCSVHMRPAVAYANRRALRRTVALECVVTLEAADGTVECSDHRDVELAVGGGRRPPDAPDLLLRAVQPQRHALDAAVRGAQHVEGAVAVEVARAARGGVELVPLAAPRQYLRQTALRARPTAGQPVEIRVRHAWQPARHARHHRVIPLTPTVSASRGVN